MITTAEIVRSVAGVWRLARRDPTGFAMLDDSMRGFWRSFWAAAIVAPGYFYITWARLQTAQDDSLHAILVEIAAYAVGWMAYPVAAHYLTEALNCGERYVLYIVAYNWAAVIQIAAYVVATMVAESEVLPDDVGWAFVFCVTLLVWVYQFYIARTALRIAPGTAAALVACDVLINLALNVGMDYVHRAGG